MVRGGLVFLLAVLAVSGTDRARDLGERGRCERAIEAGRSQWRHDPAPVLDLAIVEVTTLGEARGRALPDQGAHLGLSDALYLIRVEQVGLGLALACPASIGGDMEATTLYIATLRDFRLMEGAIPASTEPHAG